MGTVLKGATLVELEPASVEVAQLRIAHGRIAARGPSVAVEPDDEVVDLSGRLVLPGLVSAHHHFHALVLRGRARRAAGFPDEQRLLELVEEALTPDDVQALAAAGSLEGLATGTTSVLSLHAAPQQALGTPERVALALNEVGLRAVIGYELSDRNGAAARDEALAAIAAWAGNAKGRFRAAIGLAHLGTLTDEALRAVQALAQAAQLPVLANLAEDRDEEQQSVSHFGAAPVDRLMERELITSRTVLAQNVHLSWPDLSRLVGTGVWMAHAARSNMATQTGLATARKFGVRATLATDVLPLDMLTEAQAAWLRSRDSGLPIDVLRFLANGHRLASELYGFPIGPLREGAAADLAVFDYQPLTPFDALTLAHHVATALSSRHVESVMVDGAWRLWKRRPLTVTADEVNRAARDACQALWSRLPVDAAPDDFAARSSPPR